MTRLTVQQLFHVGDDDSGCFLQQSWGDDDCDGDDGDGDNSDNCDDDIYIMMQCLFVCNEKSSLPLKVCEIFFF